MRPLARLLASEKAEYQENIGIYHSVICRLHRSLHTPNMLGILSLREAGLYKAGQVIQWALKVCGPVG